MTLAPNPTWKSVSLTHIRWRIPASFRATRSAAVSAGGATHVEHYEIATYESLLTQAETMGEEDVVALLQENLEQEQATLTKVESAARRLAQAAPVRASG